MANVKNYPDQWGDYCKGVKSGGLKPLAAWNRFATQYRAASCFQSVEFIGLSEAARRSHTSIVRLFLCYSAFEVACDASGQALAKVEVSSNSGFSIKTRRDIVNCFKNLAGNDIPIWSCLANERLNVKVKEFFQGKHQNLLPVAAALRCVFSNGYWPSEEKPSLSRRACNALDCLSLRLLHVSDSLLSPYFPNKLHKQELVAYNKAA